MRQYLRQELLRAVAAGLAEEVLLWRVLCKRIDEPLTTEELQGMQGMLGIRDGVLRTSGKTNPTTRDFITFSGRGQTQDAIVGGPKEIADKLEEMFVGRGCDGFVIAVRARLAVNGDLIAGAGHIAASPRVTRKPRSGLRLCYSWSVP